MIHLLQVTPKLSLKDLKKLSRRYAMTGGYEVGLDPDLNAEELEQLAEMHIPEMEQYEKGTAKYRSNNSYRILNLIKNHELAAGELRDKIDEIISDT